jgi:hypothetical protein
MPLGFYINSQFVCSPRLINVPLPAGIAEEL